MHKGLNKVLCIVAAAVVLAVPAVAKERLAFSGGPEGGTFQYFSNAMSTRLSMNLDGVEVSNMSSVGSLANLRRVDSGEVDFGIAYSGDTFLGRNGRLANDSKKYENVHALAYLYGAPAHLITKADSGIKSVLDLDGKRVAVGDAGSGAAGAAERYFSAIGLWDKMKVEFIGYSKAAAAMGDNLIDAFWVFAGYPNSAVIQAAASNKIILVTDVVLVGKERGFFEKYPFYTEVTIPAGTYSGVKVATRSFQDSALWVAGKHVKADVVESALKDIFSNDGLAYMHKVKSTAKAMSVGGGLDGIVTPIHAGAETFWKGKGLEVKAVHSAR